MSVQQIIRVNISNVSQNTIDFVTSEIVDAHDIGGAHADADAGNVLDNVWIKLNNEEK